LLQQTINGVFLGSIYALFAVGYTLVFGILDILNLAHQAIFMLGAFVALTLVLAFGMNIFVALLAAMLVSGLLGLLLDRIAFAPLRRRPDTYFSSLITSIAMAIIFEAIALELFGARTTRFPLDTFPELSLNIAGASVTLLQLVIVLIAILLMIGLQLFIKRTFVGKAIRAVAENQRTAALLGINVDGIIALSFFISSALGGAAGVLFGLSFNAISPDIGRTIELKGLAVIILGGMGSLPGAVLGGFLLGMTEVFAVSQLGSNLRDVVAFLVLFAILLLRPRGLLGRKAVRDV
jgi:branched-chain amino acid transport system permease protein